MFNKEGQMTKEQMKEYKREWMRKWRATPGNYELELLKNKERKERRSHMGWIKEMHGKLQARRNKAELELCLFEVRWKYLLQVLEQK